YSTVRPRPSCGRPPGCRPGTSARSPRWPGPKVGKVDALAHRTEIDLDVQADGDLGGIAVDDVRQHLVPLVQVDDDGCVGHREARRRRLPRDRPAVDGASPQAHLPVQVPAPALPADGAGIEQGVATVPASLIAELADRAAVPERLAPQRRAWQGDARWLRVETGHGRVLPSNTTSLNNAPEPPQVHMTTSGSDSCTPLARPWICSTPRTTRCSIWVNPPGWLNDMVPPSVVTGCRPDGSITPAVTYSPPSPSAQNPNAS